MRFCCIFYIVVLSVTPGISQFQRNVNAVIIENDSLSDLELLTKFERLIQNSGYDICKMDSTTRMLTTNSYFVENLPLLVYYKLNVDGPYAMLRAYLMDFNNYSYSPESQHPEMKWIRVAFRSVQDKTWHACFKKLVLLSEILRSGVHGKATWLEEEKFGKSSVRENRRGQTS